MWTGWAVGETDDPQPIRKISPSTLGQADAASILIRLKRPIQSSADACYGQACCMDF